MSVPLYLRLNSGGKLLLEGGGALLLEAEGPDAAPAPRPGGLIYAIERERVRKRREDEEEFIILTWFGSN